MRYHIPRVAVLVLAVAVLLTGCGSDKGPAEQAIKAAEDAFNAAKAEAVKYVPDQVKSVEGAIAAVKDKFSKNDYKAVLTEAGAIPGKVKEMTAAASAKKEELTKTWGSLSEGLPKVVEAIQSRVDILSKAKKLPANLTAEKLAEAKSGLTAAKDEWAKAVESQKAGNIAEAVSAANSVKEKAVKAMEILGLPVPAGAKS